MFTQGGSGKNGSSVAVSIAPKISQQTRRLWNQYKKKRKT